jgi:hypothetical protein
MVALLSRPKPDSLSPARAALAEAIETLHLREREAAAIDIALIKARSDYYAADDAREKASDALKYAPALAAQHLTAFEMGEAGTAPQSPAEAGADLAATVKLAASKKAVYDQLKNTPQPETGVAMDAVRQAAAMVIRESPEFAEQIAKVTNLFRSLIEACAPLPFLKLVGAIREDREAWSTGEYKAVDKMLKPPGAWADLWEALPPDCEARWKVWFNNLLIDATAQFPAK